MVGVLNADAALSIPDFRASERTFQLIVQVAGRAGRAGKRGQVIVQTRQPDHPAIVLATRHDVKAFLEHELKDRKELNYPPYSRLALVRVASAQDAVAQRECQRLADIARRAAAGEVQVLGPAPAPLAKLRNRYRYRFLLKSARPSPIHRVLLQLLRAGSHRLAKVSLDMDPMNML